HHRLVHADARVAGGGTDQTDQRRGQGPQVPARRFVGSFFGEFSSVLTEITDINNVNGCVFFDAHCRWCADLADRFGPLLRRHRFGLLPLQPPEVAQLLGVEADDLLTEMRLVVLNPARPQPQATAIFGGADALIEIARRIWWAWPLCALAQIPGV